MTIDELRVAAAGANAAVDFVTARVLTALNEGHIKTIVIKGPPLSRWLQDEMRASGDVDLLLPEPNIPQAELILAKLGFCPQHLDSTPADRPRHARVWQQSPGTIDVDLHRTFLGTTAAADDVWNAFWSHSEQTSVCGVEMRVPTASGHAVLLTLHAAQHGRDEPAPIDDLKRALSREPPETWRGALEIATEVGALEAMAAGLMLAGAETLVSDLDLPLTGSVELALRMNSAPHTALGFDWLARQPSWRQRAVFIAGKAVPPPAYMRAWRPLARRGIAGLALAYLYRPFWLLRWTVPGYRAWRQAGKAIGSKFHP